MAAQPKRVEVMLYNKAEQQQLVLLEAGSRRSFSLFSSRPAKSYPLMFITIKHRTKINRKEELLAASKLLEAVEQDGRQQ